MRTRDRALIEACVAAAMWDAGITDTKAIDRAVSKAMARWTVANAASGSGRRSR